MIMKITSKRAHHGQNIANKDKFGIKILTTQAQGHMNPSRKNKSIENSPKTLGNLDLKPKDRKYQLIDPHKA